MIEDKRDLTDRIVDLLGSEGSREEAEMAAEVLSPSPPKR